MATSNNNNKLFYTVTEDNASNFKAASESGNEQYALGLVKTGDDGFSYIIAKGAQFGLSKNQFDSKVGDKVNSVLNGKNYVTTGTLTGTLEDYATKDYVDNNAGTNVTIDGSNNKIVGDNGVEYTLSISDGVISVSEYIALKVSDFMLVSDARALIEAGATRNSELFTISSNTTQTQYVGSTYNTGTLKITVPAPVPSGSPTKPDLNTMMQVISPKLSINIINPGNNKYDIYIKSSYYSDSYNSFANYGIEQESAYAVNEKSSISNGSVMGISYIHIGYYFGSTSGSKTGTLAWGSPMTYSITAPTAEIHAGNTSFNSKFTYTVIEKSSNKQYTGTVTMAAPTVTYKVTPKVPIMYGKTGTAAGATSYIADVIYTNASSFTLDKNFTFAAGETPVFAIPTCLNKTVTCYNSTGSMQDTNLSKTTTYSGNLNGCNTKYDIYTWSKPFAGTAEIKIRIS